MAKLDLSKAYDRLSWLFLIRAMKSLGFSEAWCDLIYRNISNCWYSIRVRGKAFGHFKSNRGLRQGDPLSPSLFIIAMEILTRKLNMAGKPGGGIMPYWSSLRALEINHILYADDILVCSNGGKSSFSYLMNVLDDFCANSGHVLQASKCKLFLSKHISNSRKEALLRISGYALGKFPIRYLGALLFSGQPRLIYFQSLVDVVKDRIEGWMKGFLSMAGRLTMIKSVLTSIPIHTLSVLPVPKGTLDSIDKLVRSFLWGGDGSARRHWVGWNTVCKDVNAGGLGIRPTHQVMTALRGKLAWKYLCNESLWSKHARSRFVIGGKGSHLWKTIAPFITSIAHDCHWRIGDGSTPVGVFCSNLALPFPKRLKLKSIKEVLSTPELRRVFLHNSHPRIYASIGVNFVEGVADRLIWNKDPSGCVSSKSFLKTFVSQAPTIRKFEVIWQVWIPPKVSCFLWKALHSALATNDNVRRAGISLASKCSCCEVAECETMDHLFFYSDMACILWDFVCPLFRKPRPRSFSSFLYEWGVSANFMRFADCLGFAIACLCIWEIWKLRNERIYDARSTKFSRRYVFSWAASLAKIIPKKCFYDYRSRTICHSLLICCPPIREFRVFWCMWVPHKFGFTCNIAINVSDLMSSMAAIIRNSDGNFIYGIKCTSTAKHFLKCLFQLINEIKLTGISSSCIQASNEDIILLNRSVGVDWSLFQIKRKLAAMLCGTSIYRVSFSLNSPAEALCFADIKSLKSNLVCNLPQEVSVALAMDAFPRPCSSLDHMVYL